MLLSNSDASGIKFQLALFFDEQAVTEVAAAVGSSLATDRFSPTKEICNEDSDDIVFCCFSAAAEGFFSDVDDAAI